MVRETLAGIHFADPIFIPSPGTALLNQTVIAVGVAQTTKSVSYVWEEIGFVGGVAVGGMAFLYVVRRRKSSREDQRRDTPTSERRSSPRDPKAT